LTKAKLKQLRAEVDALSIIIELTTAIVSFDAIGVIAMLIPRFVTWAKVC
jgi:hypothetical protein